MYTEVRVRSVFWTQLEQQVLLYIREAFPSKVSPTRTDSVVGRRSVCEDMRD